jgi:hypothetical protein
MRVLGLNALAKIRDHGLMLKERESSRESDIHKLLGGINVVGASVSINEDLRMRHARFLVFNSPNEGEALSITGRARVLLKMTAAIDESDSEPPPR